VLHLVLPLLAHTRNPARPAGTKVAEDHPLRGPLALARSKRRSPAPQIRCRHALGQRQPAAHLRRSARLRVDPLRPAAFTRRRATARCATEAMAPATAQRVNRPPRHRLLPMAGPRPRPAGWSCWHRIANWLQPGTVTRHNGLRAYGRDGFAAPAKPPGARWHRTASVNAAFGPCPRLSGRAGPGPTLDGGAHPAGRSGCCGRLQHSSQPSREPCDRRMTRAAPHRTSPSASPTQPPTTSAKPPRTAVRVCPGARCVTGACRSDRWRRGPCLPAGGRQAGLFQPIPVTWQRPRRKPRRCRWRAGPGCRGPGHTSSWFSDRHERRPPARRVAGHRRPEQR
jgi:hypothetical protein